jgi:hypothetical protein
MSLPLPPPPPGIRNPSSLSHHLPRQIPSESLPFLTSRSNHNNYGDDELIKLSTELPRPAIEATLRSQLAELDALILPLRKDQVRSSQSSPLSSSTLLSTSQNVTQPFPIRFRIDLHRGDSKDVHVTDKIKAESVVTSPKLSTPGSIFSRIERVETNPVMIESTNPVVIDSEVSKIAPIPVSSLRGLPVPLLISNKSTLQGSEYSSDLEPLVFEIQRLVACMCRGSFFIMQGGGGGFSSFVGVAMPRSRVTLHLESDLRTLCLKETKNDDRSSINLFNILDIESIKFEESRTFSLNLCISDTREIKAYHLFAPDVALSSDWVNGLTILHSIAKSCL